MTQVTVNDFEGVAKSPLVAAPTQDPGMYLWRRLNRCAAALAHRLRRSAQSGGDRTLPPPYALDRQFGQDILRVKARRLL